MCFGFGGGPSIDPGPSPEEALRQQEEEERKRKEEARKKAARRKGRRSLLHQGDAKGVERDDNDDNGFGIPVRTFY